MEDSKDSLIIEYGRLKASASGRFAIVAVLLSGIVLSLGVAYWGGSKLLDRFDGASTASVNK